MGCLTTSRKIKNELDGLNIGAVKRGSVKWERHIVHIREMINVYNALLAIKEARGHFQDAGEDVRTVIRWTTKEILLAVITRRVWLAKLSLLECRKKHMHYFNTRRQSATGLNV